MDEIIMRRLRHLQWLEETHAGAQQAPEGSDASRSEKQREEVSNVLSAEWNRKHRKSTGASSGQRLPCGWRKEHWKTQQSMARDYAGVRTDSKEEAVRVLEAFEAGDTLPPAA